MAGRKESSSGGSSPASPGRWGPRARRGGIRAGILALLVEGAMNGYQIMQELERRSRGMWRPSPGAVYPALQQLEDEGLISGESAEVGRGQSGGRTFSITSRGRLWVDRHPNLLSPWESMSAAAPSNYLELVAHIRLLRALVEQIAQGGTARQAQEADKILWQARRALLQLLAHADA